jgi:aromatic-L-amino-acid decarboxylase
MTEPAEPADAADAGDLAPAEARAALHRAADLAADYLEGVGSYPVLPPMAPGELAAKLPAEPPEEGEPMARILDDYRELIEPSVTHWNHPGFLAYFAITGSAPGVAAETLAAALNVNAMLWRTGPGPTELEERACDWLRSLMGLPEGFHGHLNDTASVSTLVALAAARHRLRPEVRARGLASLPPLVLYASDQAHSSVDKAALVLGLGTDGVRRVASDAAYRMVPEALAAAIAEDRAAGLLPMAVVATAGTTSTTSIDPLAAVAEVCAREELWLHVDAAYGGAAAICPELRPLFDGLERADSIVVNPHKWLFTPVDCSALFVRDPADLVAAFSLVPDYLQTGEREVTNLMDLGIQLGRRFRALKLWMVIRAFGAEGLRRRIRRHCELARGLAARVAAEPGFELAAPAPLSVVCLRAFAGRPDDERDRLNEALLDAVNADGRFLLSHTRLGGRYVIRVAIGNLKTEARHLDALWELLAATARRLGAEGAGA